MRVESFGGRYGTVAALAGTDAERMRAQDDFAGETHRWLAFDGDDLVGAVTVRYRPDGRRFLAFIGEDNAILAPLTEAVTCSIGTPVFTTLDDGARRLPILESVGFDVEVITERFVVPFDIALARLSRVSPPRGVNLVSANTADPDQLFALDNTVRNDVPGCDGWVGNRDWFDDELSPGPPFDPSAYLVAVDDRYGAYVGLVRIWRNHAGPRLGLVGVLRSRRGTMLGPWLLQQAIAAASNWGHAAFTTETSPSNRSVHPYIVRMGARSDGKSLQMALR